MLLTQFINARCIDLEKITTFGRTRWSQYDRGQPIDERTLEAISAQLGIPVPDVLYGIRERRKRKGCKGLKPRSVHELQTQSKNNHKKSCLELTA